MRAGLEQGHSTGGLGTECRCYRPDLCSLLAEAALSAPGAAATAWTFICRQFGTRGGHSQALLGEEQEIRRRRLRGNLSVDFGLEVAENYLADGCQSVAALL